MSKIPKYVSKAEKALKKAGDEALKKQTKEGFVKLFNVLGLKGVAKEIKAGRNVRGNVAYGIKHGVHDKLGARYNPSTGKFFPMTKKAKAMESRFITLSNKLLKAGGYKPLNKRELIAELRRKDAAFKKKIKNRIK